MRGADLDVVVAIGFGGDHVEPADRAQDLALRDAEGVVELGDAGGLELGVVLGRATGVGELGGVDEVREVHAGGMIEVGALGDTRFDRDTLWARGRPVEERFARRVPTREIVFVSARHQA